MACRSSTRVRPEPGTSARVRLSLEVPVHGRVLVLHSPAADRPADGDAAAARAHLRHLRRRLRRAVRHVRAVVSAGLAQAPRAGPDRSRDVRHPRLGAHLVSATVGAIATGIALFAPMPLPLFSGFTYFLMGPAHWAFGLSSL